MNNFKVGTTTWLTQFLKLSKTKKKINSGKNYSQILHLIVPGLFRIPSLSKTNISSLAESTVSFSMVRHPFER